MYYYKLQINEFKAQTCRLSYSLQGIYVSLVNECYLRECFPESLEVAADWLWITSETEKADLLSVLNRFFTNQDGKFVHLGVENDIKAFKSRSEKAKESVNKRWQKTTNKIPEVEKRNTDLYETYSNEYETYDNQYEHHTDNILIKNKEQRIKNKEQVITNKEQETINKDQKTLTLPDGERLQQIELDSSVDNVSDKEETALVEKEPKEPRTPTKEINDTFNEICGEVGLTKWTTLSDKRRTEIRKLWKKAKEIDPEFTLAHWFHLCVMIAEEKTYEWTRGGLSSNGVKYKPRDISFLLKNDHLLKAIEFRDQRTNGEYLPTPQEIETAKNKDSHNV